MSSFRHWSRRFQSGQILRGSGRACQDRRADSFSEIRLSPRIWRFFSRIALCSLCTIMPLRFVQVYKVCYLCKMLLTICGKCAKIQTVREQRTPRQPEGPAEERSGGTVRTLARERRNGRRDTPDKTDQPRRDRRSGPRKRTKNKPSLARASDGSSRRKRKPPWRAGKTDGAKTIGGCLYDFT